MAYKEQVIDLDFFEGLDEYDSMNDAISALGEGKPFLASLANIEGWSYRGLYVTPFLGS